MYGLATYANNVAIGGAMGSCRWFPACTGTVGGSLRISARLAATTLAGDSPLANACAPRPDAVCACARCLRLRPADSRHRGVRRSPHADAGSRCHAHLHTYADSRPQPNADGNPNAEPSRHGRPEPWRRRRRPPATPAQTSPETDREALVALYATPPAARTGIATITPAERRAG